MGFLPLLGIGASIFGAVSQYQEGQQQAQYLRQQAELDNARADEFLLRTEKNIQAREKQVGKVIGGQKVALAKAGIELGTGVSLDMMEDAYMALAEEEELVRDEANYQANSIRSGADAKNSQASDASAAGGINAFTSLLGGITRFANIKG